MGRKTGYYSPMYISICKESELFYLMVQVTNITNIALIASKKILII